MKLPKPITIDFETLPILPRPHYPPTPVSVSIKEWKKKAKFYAWGHITGGNNCTYTEAKEALTKAYESGRPLLFQNAKFDLAVAHERLGLPLPPWQRVHDTLLLLFLYDPRQTELALKPASERILGWAPEEQDAVADWLIANQPVSGKKLGRAKGPNYFGAYIAYCPGYVVGPYADGDTSRTEALFEHVYPIIMTDSRAEAYDRERRVLNVLMDMEPQGVPVDHERLSHDVERYTDIHERLTAWVKRQLKVESDFNLDSDKQLLPALIDSQKVDESQLLVTAKGNLSVSKESLANAMTDRQLLSVLSYRAELGTCLQTFMRNWCHVADLSGGLIYTNWNQVRQPNERGKGTAGARTGRLSSTPNFQNAPNAFDAHFKHLLKRENFESQKKFTSARAELPKAPFELPSLPLVRSYITAHPGHVLIDRDYSQQELRILGTYEGGPLLEAYQEDPWMDVHDWAREMINELLMTNYPRKPIKNTGFGLIYGMGLGKLAIQTNSDFETAKELKNAYLTVAPGLKDMYKDMRYRARNQEPIMTWGGRLYLCEEPKIIAGKMREFDYKLVNVLIQGGAADITKEAFINYYELKPDDHKLLLTVHDELLGSVPREERDAGMEIMREAMEKVELEVPLFTEGEWSPTNWAEMQTYDKRGKLLV